MKFKQSVSIFLNDYFDYILLFLFSLIISCYYLYSGNNLTGMLEGDGYTHSLVAENIYKIGKITYEMPYKIFNGEKINNQIVYTPIGYTQFYHLTLATFNKIFNLNLFSPIFSILINLINISLMYLILQKNKPIRVVIPVSVLLITSNRSMLINFMEPFLLMMFLSFMFWAVKLSENNMFCKNKWIWGLIAYFIGCLAITKHLGLFNGLASLIVLSGYLLIKKQIKTLILIILIFMFTVSLPLFTQLRGVGSLGYPVGTLSIPKSIPFSSLIADNFFNSKYQPISGLESRKLSYHRSIKFTDNVYMISNYFWNFGYLSNSENLNIYVLVLITISIIFLVKKNKLISALVLTIFATELFFLNYENLRITQYNIILSTLLLFLLFYPFHIFFSLPKFNFLNKKLYYVLINIIIIFSLFVSFLYIQHKKIYSNTGRWNYNQEVLYSKLGNQILSRKEFENKIFLASDIQFGYHTKKDYIWFSNLFFENIEDKKIDKYYDLVKEYFNAEYLVVSSVNLRNRGLYDHIPENTIEYLENNNRIQLIEHIEEGNDFIKLFRLM